MIFSVINTHWKGIHFHKAVIIKYFSHMIMQSQDTQRTSQKISTVIVCVKTYQVSTIHTFKNLSSPFAWQKTEYFIRWKRNVQEETDFSIAHFFTQHSGQQHQVIIVYPDSIASLCNAQKRFAVNTIHFNIFIPVLFFIRCKRREIMEERPDGFIAEALVKPFHSIFGKKH